MTVARITAQQARALLAGAARKRGGAAKRPAMPKVTLAPALDGKPQRKKRQLREHRLQRRVAEYLTIALPEDGPTAWTSIDHANAKSLIEGANRKRRGVKPGLPDVWIIHQPEGRGVRRYPVRLVQIELKDEDGCASNAQVDWAAEVSDLGVLIYQCRSVEEVQRALEDAGVPLAARVAL